VEAVWESQSASYVHIQRTWHVSTVRCRHDPSVEASSDAGGDDAARRGEVEEFLAAGRWGGPLPFPEPADDEGLRRRGSSASARKRKNLEIFQKREQRFEEQYQRNKPLRFSARAFQDADATLTSPMLLGVCDGVSQLEAALGG